MKIETLPRDDHQVNLVVEIDQDQLTSAKRRAARRISERKSIPGFRPGKAPFEVVLRTYGDAAITEDAVDILLEEVYPKALDEAGIKPGAAGALEKVEDIEKTPKFTFLVPLAPTIDLGDYRSVRQEYDWKEPGEDKVDQSLEEMRQMYAKTETVDRPVQKGDFVLIDLKGLKEGAAEDETPLLDRTNLPVFIRMDEKPDEFPFHGFSNELVGLSANESKTFIHAFDPDAKETTLAGQTVNFNLTVKMVRGSTLPELDDEFAKQVGPFDTIQALREAIKANLATQSKAQYDDDYFSKLMEQIKEGAQISYPPQVVDHEVEHVMEDLKTRLASQNLDLPAYLKSRQTDEEKFISEEARPVAVKRLERALIMDELAKQEKIEISQDQLKSSFQDTWGEYQSDPGIQKQLKGKSQPPKKLLDAVAVESANRAFVQLTLNRLKEIATGQAAELEKPGGELANAEQKPSARRSASSKAKKPASAKKVAVNPKKAAAKTKTNKPSSSKKKE